MIRRWKRDVLPIDKLKPHPSNKTERKISHENREGLRFSLHTFGDVQPVVWNSRSGYIVGGHERVTIHREEGDTDVEVIVVDLDEAAERALRIALNSGTITGDFDAGLQSTLDRIEAESRELLEGLRLDELQAEEEERVDVYEVHAGDVGDTFVVTVLGPIPQQSEVLEQLRRALLEIPGCEVQIQTQKRG